MQNFRISVSGSDKKAFNCASDDTILSAALRSGNGLHYECNSGGCGSCQFELVEGQIKDLWPEANGLSERARSRGRRLACQSVPLSDCTIRASLSDSDAPVIVPHRTSLTYRAANRLTSDMTEFCFQSNGAANFLPGQFAMIGLPGVDGLRAYSMSNLPNESGEWRFIVKRVPAGKGTAVMFDSLGPGDEVSLDAPYGNSYLRTDNGRDVVCVAGGSGLSPVLSILRAAARAPELSGRRIMLFYGGRGPGDIVVDEILSSDPILKERVAVYTAISDDNAPDAENWQGERGFIHELVRKVIGNECGAFDYYFCGPPPMTDAVHRMLLLDFKVPSGQLHFDRFF